MPEYTVTACKNASGRPLLYRKGQFCGYLSGLGVPDGARVTVSWGEESEHADLDCVPPEAFVHVTPAELLKAAEDSQEWPTRWSTNIHAWAKAVVEQLESLRDNLGTVAGRVEVLESCAEVGTANEVRKLREHVTTTERELLGVSGRVAAIEDSSDLREHESRNDETFTELRSAVNSLLSGVNDLNRRVQVLEGKR